MKRREVTLIFPGQGEMTKLRKGWLGKHVSLRLPLSVLFVATPLLKNGYKVKILDLRLDRFQQHDFSNDICVGISAITSGQITHGLEAAKWVRHQYPGIPIVWGGIHPTTFQEQTMANPSVDIIVKHEGEATFLELVQLLENDGMREDSLRKVQGIVFKGSDGAVVNNPNRPFLDFNTVDLPAYELVDIDRYFGIRHTFDYQSSRGCPFNCGFCYNKVFNDLRWRPRSADRVVDELLYLQNKYNVKEFSTVDDEFFINMKRDAAIVEKLVEKNSKSKWAGFCRFDTFARLEDAWLPTLKASGMEQIWMGAESGNTDLLQYMDKRITIEQILSAMARTRKVGIRPAVSFILGSLGETDQSIEDTLRLYDKIQEVHPEAEINGIFVYTPYPGAPMYEDAVKNGFDPPQSLEEWGVWEFNYKVNHKWLTQKQLERIKTIAWLARFRFFSMEFVNRNKKKKWLVNLFKFFNAPIELSYKLRWRNRMFRYAYEWRLWAFAIKKTFGFI